MTDLLGRTPTDTTHHLPTNPTRTELLERHWYAFLKFQQAEIRKRQQSGFGVPKGDFSEEAFWEFYVEHKLEGIDEQTN